MRARFFASAVVLGIAASIIGIMFITGCGEGLTSSGNGSPVPGLGTIYVSDSDDDCIYVYNLNTNSTATVELPSSASPNWMALSPDKQKLYCSDTGSGKLHVISLSPLTYEAGITCNVLPAQPTYGIAFPRNSNCIFVTNGWDVSVIDLDDYTYHGFVYGTGGSTQLYGIASHPIQNKIYTAKKTDNKILTSTATWSVSPSTLVDVDTPHDLAINSDGSRLFASCNSPTRVVVISTEAATIISSSETPFGGNYTRIKLAPDGQTLFVGCRSYSYIDYAAVSDTLAMHTITLESGHDSIDFDFYPDSSRILILSEDDPKVLIYSISSMSKEAEIDLPSSGVTSIVYKP